MNFVRDVVEAAAPEAVSSNARTAATAGNTPSPL